MMVVAANLVAMVMHGAIMAVVSGADADGQGLGGGGAQQGGRKGHGEGGDNEFFHDRCPLER